MGIKTIYRLIEGVYKDKKGKLHNVVTYTDSLEIIEKYKNEILGYEMANINDLNYGEILDDTFEADTLRVKEGVAEYREYYYHTLEDEYYFKDDYDEDVIAILDEDEYCLEISIWELVHKE